MFCKNCGRKMEEGQQFCAACGTRVSVTQEGQARNPQVNSVQPQMNSTQPQVNQNQPQINQGQPMGQQLGQTMGQPAQMNPNAVNQAYYNNSMINSNTNQVKGNSSQNSKRTLLALGVIALIVLGIYFGPRLFKGGLFGGSSASSPEGVVKAFFNSVYKEDPDAMLKLIYKEDLEQNKDELDKEYLQSMLEEVNAAMKSQYGDDWIKKVEYKSATETDSTSDYKQYKVKVIMDGEADYMYVKKVGSKYYLDPDTL